jgi:hypothetical protein
LRRHGQLRCGRKDVRSPAMLGLMLICLNVHLVIGSCVWVILEAGAGGWRLGADQCDAPFDHRLDCTFPFSLAVRRLNAVETTGLTVIAICSASAPGLQPLFRLTNP